jgi:predicted GH43/DUF377 family glycosyl hydrolase
VKGSSTRRAAVRATDMAQLTATRTKHRLLPDARRVIAKPYLPGEELVPGGDSRTGLLMKRVLAIPEAEVNTLLGFILREFSHRHHGFETLLERHFELVAHHLPPTTGHISRERSLLIGAYYTHEYSVEGAALFNPSLVLAPDQSGMAEGERRVVMSVRAVGEGHISSIEFRSGVVSEAGEVRFDPPAARLVTGQRTAPVRYNKAGFTLKLRELDADNELAWTVLDRLPARFTLAELEHSLARLEHDGTPHAISFETTRIIRLLAASSYVTAFPEDSALSERILFPAGPHESRGMEDARFVRFREDDGTLRYYATYTAYDGFGIIPQLIETDDFRCFTISTLNGAAAQNKGMALFPRKIDGKYVMLSRKDRENLHLATSDDVAVWNDVVELDRPTSPWELVQIGNCGSPLETSAGWLVLTHGVGAMRRYAIGAILLDLEDPRKVIGRLPLPLLEPDETEREGYTPNVVYTCGGMVHGEHLILPYGVSDGAVGVATVPIRDLLAAFV